MGDVLVQLGRRPGARKMVTRLGLPLPLPQDLERSVEPWSSLPLRGRSVVVRCAQLAPEIANSLAAAGAEPFVAGELTAFLAAGEAWGHPPKPAEAADRPHALIFDATDLDVSKLHELYDFFHGRIRSLRRCGRVVILCRPPGAGSSPSQAAAASACDGFMRSLGREIGRKGATSLLLEVDPAAAPHLDAALRFFLSPRSAFVSGQRLRLSSAFQAQPVHVRPLEGKTALVTGAARGIGAATARALAREGASVVILDRPADDGPASRVASEIGGRPLLVDVSAPEAPERIAAAFPGGLDIVVHNAGITRDKTLAKMDEARWEQTLDINLAAVMRIQEALPLRDGGRVICLSSIAGIAGNVGQTNYAASKAGIIGLVRVLAPGLAERGSTINAVAPGFIETRLTHAIPVATREVARRLSNLAQGGLPADVAEVITFLASPGAGLSGQILRVCGGNFVGA